MLRSVYSKTLRDMRWGVLGWGFGLGIYVVVVAFAFVKAYPDAASRAQLEAQIRGGLSFTQVIYGAPHAIGGLGGFIEWRVFGLAPLVLGLYLVLAATGMTRGGEESHTIEAVAATPRARSRLLVEQTAALGTALAVMLLLVGVMTALTPVASGEPAFGALRIIGTCLNLGAAASFFAALGLLSAQLFQRRRTAALAASGVMVILHLANTLPLIVPNLRGLRYVSPLYLFSRSTPLSNGHIDWAALAFLVLAAVAVAVLAMIASARRDLFDTYRLPRWSPPWAHRLDARIRPGAARGQLFLHNAFGRGLRDSFGMAAAWAIGLSLLAVLLTAVEPNARQALLQQDGAIARQLERAGLTTDRAILSILLFSLLPILLAIFGVTLAAGWASDELNERLEVELCAPVPRWRIFAERLIAAVGAQAVVVISVAVATVATIEAVGLAVPAAAAAAAVAGLLVFAACIDAFGFAVAGWRPGLTTAAAGAFVALSYFADVLIPLFGAPAWVRNVTVFGLYGTPLVDGVSYLRMGALLTVSFVLAAAGAAMFQRRDIVK